MEKKNLHILISGGGTGGHIFPAIAIANAVKYRFPDANILFVGAKSKMEMTKVPEAGYPIKGLWISGFQRRLTLKNLSFPLKLIFSLIKANRIIKQFKPNIVIGVGGYASGPTLKMAVRNNIPTLIQEQNSFPGITNRFLAKNVNTICVAYDGLEKYFPKEKIVLTGNPIRKEVIEIEGKKIKAQKFFNLEKNKKTVLVVGGSQGAVSINKSIAMNIDLFEKNNIQLIWQTGKFYFNEAQKLTKDVNHIKVHEFIREMDYAYAAADLVISRAGAIAISELSAVQKPIIFIPLPFAAEDHQTKNAQALVNKDAALMIKDSDANEQLPIVLLSLMQNEKKLKTLSQNIKAFALPKATALIVDEIEKLIS
jgi:UDP-N-acetylglucosamine--N-acetylmuramyl-(pentapeptide) pyrophosphoryl-undecaprenol N-acetylglucosamine transferase